MNIPMPPIKMADLESNLVPEATYNLRVHSATYVPLPRDRNASPYIKTVLIITGPHSQWVGRTIFRNYPTSGKSYMLRELLAATAYEEDFVLADPSQLLNLEFKGLVMIEKGTNGYPDKNTVKKHLPAAQR